MRDPWRQNFGRSRRVFLLCGPVVGGGKRDGMPTQAPFSLHALIFNIYIFIHTCTSRPCQQQQQECHCLVLFFCTCGVQVKEICTRGPKMVAAARSDTIEACVKKMIAADVRHLPVIDDDTGEVFGLISVKASRRKKSLLS